MDCSLIEYVVCTLNVTPATFLPFGPLWALVFFRSRSLLSSSYRRSGGSCAGTHRVSSRPLCAAVTCPCPLRKRTQPALSTSPIYYLLILQSSYCFARSGYRATLAPASLSARFLCRLYSCSAATFNETVMARLIQKNG